MYARSTTVQARPDRVDAGAAFITEEVMPVVGGLDGYVGMSLLIDRESGRCVATTAWRDRAALQASADQVVSVRRRAAEAFGAADPVVEDWEIAVVHRAHPSSGGSGVRATWLKMRPAQFDRGVEFYRSSVLPAMAELDGFCGASLMIDRESGRAVSSTSFDSMSAMAHTRDAARSIRTARLRDLGADQLDVGEFELAIAALRVPEMA